MGKRAFCEAIGVNRFPQRELNGKARGQEWVADLRPSSEAETFNTRLRVLAKRPEGTFTQPFQTYLHHGVPGAATLTPCH